MTEHVFATDHRSKSLSNAGLQLAAVDMEDSGQSFIMLQCRKRGKAVPESVTYEMTPGWARNPIRKSCGRLLNFGICSPLQRLQKGKCRIHLEEKTRITNGLLFLRPEGLATFQMSQKVGKACLFDQSGSGRYRENFLPLLLGRAWGEGHFACIWHKEQSSRWHFNRGKVNFKRLEGIEQLVLGSGWGKKRRENNKIPREGGLAQKGSKRARWPSDAKNEHVGGKKSASRLLSAVCCY